MLSSRKLTFVAALFIVILLPFAVLAQTPTSTVAPTFVPTNSPSQNTVLNYGDRIQAAITASDSAVVYTFSGHKGDVIAATVTSQVGSWMLVVQNSAGMNVSVSVSGSFDPAYGYSNFILPFRLEADDTYSLIVQNEYGNTGLYTLSLFKPVLNPVEPGQAVEGDLGADELAMYYTFNGKGGDVVSIALNSTGFDPYLIAAQFSLIGAGIQADDNDGGGTNALVGPYTLQNDDLYLVVVTRSNTPGNGHFSLLVNQPDVPMLAYGDSVQAVFTPQIPFVYYRFAAHANDIVSVHVDSEGSVDTLLTLLDIGNGAIVTDDDSADGYDPEVTNLQIALDGIYGIKLTLYSFYSSGKVTLTLNSRPPVVLNDVPQDIDLNSKRPIGFATFMATANEHVQLHLEMNTNNTNPSITVTQDGKTIGSISPSGFPTMTADFIVPKAGAVQLQINSYQEVHIRMWVEQLENPS